ncbi:MAG: hypothetical protein KIT80_16345 [Chitinophagaceae bacterium]|nr:hypothetical protein [Chitinophagaceae bacterium]MCW5928488.1 hypothetical protein [Chitinophagaceae bacterium]
MISRLILLFITVSLIFACKKQDESTECSPGKPILRTITGKKATVRITATAVMPVYLVEEGTIDSKLIPCNLPMDYYKEGLVVTISGRTQLAEPYTSFPCCIESLFITAISK